MGIRADISKVDPDTKIRMGKLGWPPEDQDHAAAASKQYGNGVETLSKFGIGKVKGEAILHAAFATKKFAREAVEAVIPLVASHQLDGPSIFAASEGVKMTGKDQTFAAIDLGYRRRDIVHAARAIKLWPRLQDGVEGMKEMIKLFKNLRIEIVEEDIRYSAQAFKNLTPDLLERALRDRHPKNEKENWSRGASIPILAFCYRLAAPHVGECIDKAIAKGVARDRIGHEVVGMLRAKTGRAVPLPAWL